MSRREAAKEALRRVVSALRRATGTSGGGRQPRTTVRTETAVPGWLLRLGIPLTVLLAGTGVARTTSQWSVVAVVALLLAVVPNGALVPVGVGVLAAMLALLGSPSWWSLPVLLLATHALLVLGSVATATSWRARVEVGVLRDLLPSFLAVQLVAQGAGIGASVLDGAAPVPWLVVVAVVALGALSWLVVAQLSRRPQTTPPRRPRAGRDYFP